MEKLSELAQASVHAPVHLRACGYMKCGMNFKRVLFEASAAVMVQIMR